MPYYKFGKNDIFNNIIKTHPKVEFFIYNKKVYYNREIADTGEFTPKALHMDEGSLSLYEINVDRPSGQLVYPFVTKDGTITSFRTVSTSQFNNDFAYGDTITGGYPLTASISRDYYSLGQTRTNVNALKNTLNFYRSLSKHYQYSNSSRDLGNIALNLISIPSIFYGSSIKKGSIDLKFHVSGSVIAQVRDENRNGELVQVGPAGSAGSGSVVGVALYTEGFLVLTGAAAISAHSENYVPAGTDNPKWIHFATTGSTYGVQGSSFTIGLEGTNEVPVLTMLAHAPAGELNHSNNPTFIKYSDAEAEPLTSTMQYLESSKISIKSIVSSSFADPTGSFEKHVYISKIGLYDKDKNLIGIAKLATPVRKREIDSYTFKLKLDF